MTHRFGIEAYLNRPLFLSEHAQAEFIAAFRELPTLGEGGIGAKLKALLGADMRRELKPLARGPVSSEGTPNLWDWTDGDIAVIRISGPLSDRALYWGDDLWRDGYDRIQAAHAQAQSAPDIAGVMFQMDTPGGLVDGCFETVRAIRADKAAGGKPVWASICDCAASAGYALASSADRIIATETGMSGSIGVIMLFTDLTGALEEFGVKMVPIHFGDFKTDGAWYQAFEDGERARLQSLVDELGQVFVAHVAEGRGLDPQSIIDQQAGVFIGRQGVEAGLVDAIATRSAALAELKQSLAGTLPAPIQPAATAVGVNPADKENDMTLKAELDALLAQGSTELDDAEKAALQKALGLAQANSEDEEMESEDEDATAEGDDEDAEAEGDGEDAEAETDDEDAEAEGEDEDAEAEGDDEDAQARIFAILDHPEAKGRQKLARQLAKQGLSVKAAAAALKAAPKATRRMDQIRTGSPGAATAGTGDDNPNDVVARAKAARAKLKGK